MSDEELCEQICQLEKENRRLKQKIEHRNCAIQDMAEYIDNIGICVEESQEDICDAEHCVECIIKHFMEGSK